MTDTNTNPPAPRATIVPNDGSRNTMLVLGGFTSIAASVALFTLAAVGQVGNAFSTGFDGFLYRLIGGLHQPASLIMVAGIVLIGMGLGNEYKREI